MNRLGTKIREARENKRFLSKKIAEIVGISASYFCDIEKGKRKPSMEVLEKICKVLDLSYIEMFKIGEYPGAQQLEKVDLELERSAEDHELLLAFVRGISKLTPEEKNIIKFILTQKDNAPI